MEFTLSLENKDTITTIILSVPLEILGAIDILDSPQISLALQPSRIPRNKKNRINKIKSKCRINQNKECKMSAADCLVRWTL